MTTISYISTDITIDGLFNLIYTMTQGDTNEKKEKGKPIKENKKSNNPNSHKKTNKPA